MIEINIEQFKKASKKILNEKNLCNNLSSVNELLARGLGFRNYNDFKNSVRKTNVTCIPSFKGLSEIEIINNYICSKKKYESIMTCSEKFPEFNYVKDNIWNRRALCSLQIMISFNKKMYELGLLNFSFKSLSKLFFNFNLIYEIDILRELNIPSKNFPTLTQKDVLDFDFLNELKKFPYYKLNSKSETFERIEDSWMSSLLIIKPILKEFLIFDDNTDCYLLNKYLQARESMEKRVGKIIMSDLDYDVLQISNEIEKINSKNL